MKLTAIQRLAETGAGRVKTLKGEGGEGKEGSESEGALHIHAVRNRKEAYR